MKKLIALLILVIALLVACDYDEEFKFYESRQISPIVKPTPTLDVPDFLREFLKRN